MIPYEEELKNRRDYVEESIKETWNARTDWYNEHSDFEPFAETSFFGVIWDMSTKILPHLEVQVVIDDNDNCFVSSGSTGFVSFMQQPTGMKLPIKCWIHTHPFGKAYFSGTDWKHMFSVVENILVFGRILTLILSLFKKVIWVKVIIKINTGRKNNEK